MINNWILYFVITFVLLWISFMTISNLVLLLLRADEFFTWWKAIISGFLVSTFATVYVFNSSLTPQKANFLPYGEIQVSRIFLAPRF